MFLWIEICHHGTGLRAILWGYWCGAGWLGSRKAASREDWEIPIPGCGDGYFWAGGGGFGAGEDYLCEEGGLVGREGVVVVEERRVYGLGLE